MAAKGFDARDTVLRIGITQRLVQQLSREALKGNVSMLGKRKGVRVWLLPSRIFPAPVVLSQSQISEI